MVKETTIPKMDDSFNKLAFANNFFLNFDQKFTNENLNYFYEYNCFS